MSDDQLLRIQRKRIQAKKLLAQKKMSPEEEEPSTLDNIATGAKELGESAVDMARGFSIGKSIPIVGPAITGLADKAYQLATDTSDEEMEGRQAKFRKDDEDYAERFPKAEFAKNVGGSLMLPGPKGSITSKMMGPAKALPATASTGQKLARFGRNTAEVAGKMGERGVVAGGEMYADQKLRGYSNEEALDTADTATYVAGGLTAFPHLAKNLTKFYGRYGPGLKNETVQKYRAKRQAVNDLNENELAENLHNDARKLRTDAAAKKDEVKYHLRDKKTERRDAIREMREGQERTVRDRQYEVGQKTGRMESEAKLSEKESIDAAKEEASTAKQSAYSKADQLQKSAADGIDEAYRNSGQSIHESSEEVLAILDKANQKVKIPTTVVKNAIKRALKAERVGKADGITPDLDALKKFRDWLTAVDQKEVTPREAKRMIQTFDSVLKKAYHDAGEGLYIGRGGAKAMGVRSNIDDLVGKKVEGYKEAMVPLADKVKTKVDFEKKFRGGPDEIYRALDSINEPDRINRKGVLQKFQKTFAGDQDYLAKNDAAQDLRSYDYEGNIAKPKIAAAKATTAQKMTEIDAIIKEAKDLTFEERKSMGHRIHEMNAKQIDRVYANILKNAKAKHEIGARIPNEGAAKRTLRQFGSDPENYNYQGKKIAAVSEASGKAGHYEKQAEILGLKNAMKAVRVNGSRNTNLAADSLSGAMAAFTGNPRAGIVARGIGSILGGIVDVVGAKPVKAIYDFIDSPSGVRFRQAFEAAAKRGPQAVAMTHAMLMKNDPYYRKEIESRQMDD